MENVTINNSISLLHKIAECISEAIENNENESAISEVVELMKGIYEDNWVYVRN